MTSPRASYGGAYYHAPAFPDTPIYDSLVAERGTPQIAPIRVPSAYDTGSTYLPALPAALPALPAAPSPQPAAPSYGGGYGYPQPAAPLQHAMAPQVPQQTPPPRGYGYPGPQQQPQPPRPAPAGYDAMRPVGPPRPAPVAAYEDPYRRPYQGGGY
ncbi:hypothetical protein I3F58_25095 [Streptomyces sp. MUM 203J]|uniref:DUF6643 family protein n=1 Tax=Streptomyces sp. MUM 203J TaxID=2791990 RepID=UPI001F0495B0|nr:DUF6643 family protein [Streptomyces sp. MUM 203J]MCH0542778.1 hypothetical protein [Streptomyces sp. MUM 203J]